VTAFLLSLHVLAAIVFIGPVTVATSLFPRYARAALAANGGAEAERARAVVDLLHRISRVYAVLGVSVPVFGIATAIRLGVLGDAWLIVSLLLTAVAAGILALVVLPGQSAVVVAVHGRPGAAAGRTARLAAASGIFALVWAVVVVLMIVRPGSTTGV
jgi:hypothetical protein